MTNESLSEFTKELEDLINKHSLENLSGVGEGVDGTPDFILAEYLTTCLVNFSGMTKRRSQWYEKSVTA